MDIQQSTVKKLLITGVESLDPVSVFFENYGDGQGKVVIECYGKS